MEKYTYLLVNIFTILVPFIMSFDKRIKFFKTWKALFPAIIITGAFFLIWDVKFTQMQVWLFSRTYTMGINYFGLPLEEYLFFLTVPYACVFTYKALNYYIKKDILGKYQSAINIFLIGLLTLVAILNLSKLYTSVTFLLTALFISFHQFMMESKYLGRFYVSWIVTLIPFFIVNGILTALPVVVYNNAENLGIRLYTIPIEDTIYGMLLLMMNVSIYEYFLSKQENSENPENTNDKNQIEEDKFEQLLK